METDNKVKCMCEWRDKDHGIKWTKQSVIVVRADIWRRTWKGLRSDECGASKSPQNSTPPATMTDKDNSRPYHYEPYPAKANNTNSLKRNETKTSSNTSSLIHNSTGKQAPGGGGGGGSKCCCCTISARSATFWASFLTNLGICTLLFGYTLLGKRLWLNYYCTLPNNRQATNFVCA